MRKLIVQQYAVSLDGFTAVEGGEGWSRWRELVDPELDAHIVERIQQVGTHIMGRDTYEGHAEHWPAAANSSDPSEHAIAAALNNGSKVAFSRSLTEVAWPGTALASGDTAEEVMRLKAEPGGDILAVGGVSFLRSLVQLRLFDTIRLYVVPYLAGSGASIFSDLDAPVDLTLTSHRAFSCGVLELIYDKAS